MMFVDRLVFEQPKAAMAKTIIKALATGTGLPDLAPKRKPGPLVTRRK